MLNLLINTILFIADRLDKAEDKYRKTVLQLSVLIAKLENQAKALDEMALRARRIADKLRASVE